MSYLEERFKEGYKLIVVRRSAPGKYLCSKQKVVEESGTLKLYDEFDFKSGDQWKYIYNVIYKIEDLIK